MKTSCSDPPRNPRRHRSHHSPITTRSPDGEGRHYPNAATDHTAPAHVRIYVQEYIYTAEFTVRIGDRTSGVEFAVAAAGASLRARPDGSAAAAPASGGAPFAIPYDGTSTRCTAHQEPGPCGYRRYHGEGWFEAVHVRQTHDRDYRA